MSACALVLAFVCAAPNPNPWELVNEDDGIRVWRREVPGRDLAEAKAQLSELTRRAIAGEEVIIARDNTPLVRLVPIQAASGPRRPGSGKGQLIWMASAFQ